MSIKIPRGFKFAVTEAAIKRPGRKDLALIYSDVEATAFAVFTKNLIKAAPVKIAMKKIPSQKARIIIANSGNANACTGKKGLEDTQEIIRLISKGLGVDERYIYPASTGVIGIPLPMERIKSAIPGLIAGLGRSTFEDVARAIMTTDTFPKYISTELKIGTETGTISAIAKGAGMINPSMATMLCFIITDLSVERISLAKALKEAVDLTFNRITIDGATSTNDMVMIMANSLAGNDTITLKSRFYKDFKNSLISVTEELARMIVKDGEGATKSIKVIVKGATSKKDAELAARAVANSLLVKTALYGNDANWGRIMASLGASGAKVLEERIDIYFNHLQIVKRGLSAGNDSTANELLKTSKELNIIIDLGVGQEDFTVLTCDLSEDYVRINATYRT
ncbi:MAG: bifunctional glutamate N-acetyltransferase/amino-acid acetyltransferase ArgJ [Thermodesulfovibrionales bacterium]|nr:bifunctional glutamate N-acetyltransferase/amino-acid acetyltransferase ArgJ [Thermodesulfovibrionales bacterium]